ncbi:DUF1772 domain-containing protein [Sinorhizobium meliloti]|uniref:DUF1772 domain-containing protein n=1 Tax=Rhizobium meliloti TaxID=382 RepID=UPI001F329C5E|nr:DUF1772 domain-containing protein [Sinorhizobium meliloti]WQP11956.1 DUF1772 domain-containing protein [Sinorhizobium meliloti]
MLVTVEVLTIVLVAIATALALAHALELPGKLRLPRDVYQAIQAIYYPGFTIGGAAEPAALLLTAALLFLMPSGTAAFWLTVGAFAGLLAMHAAYWILTHPVNNFWLKDTQLGGTGAAFSLSAPLALLLPRTRRTGPPCGTAGSGPTLCGPFSAS